MRGYDLDKLNTPDILDMDILNAVDILGYRYAGYGFGYDLYFHATPSNYFHHFPRSFWKWKCGCCSQLLPLL